MYKNLFKSIILTLCLFQQQAKGGVLVDVTYQHHNTLTNQTTPNQLLILANTQIDAGSHSGSIQYFIPDVSQSAGEQSGANTFSHRDLSFEKVAEMNVSFREISSELDQTLYKFRAFFIQKLAKSLAYMHFQGVTYDFSVFDLKFFFQPPNSSIVRPYGFTMILPHPLRAQGFPESDEDIKSVICHDLEHVSLPFEDQESIDLFYETYRCNIWEYSRSIYHKLYL